MGEPSGPRDGAASLALANGRWKAVDYSDVDGGNRLDAAMWMGYLILLLAVEWEFHYFFLC